MNPETRISMWSADWSVFGFPVWHSLIVGVVCAVLVSRFSPLPVHIRRRLLAWLPGLMLLNCFFTRWVNTQFASSLGNLSYKHYYASFDVAFVVTFAFGVAFTIAALRASERSCRIVGWSFAPVYLCVLVGALCYLPGAFRWLGFEDKAGQLWDRRWFQLLPK